MPTRETQALPRHVAIARVLRYDLPASVVVFLVAVPLSLGIALASGAPVVSGLVAAVVGGIVAGTLGGSVVQVTGPAAGLTVVIASTINEFGWAATCALTVAAGVVQLLLGACGLARVALLVSPAIVHGMLGGIGVTIALAQLHVVLGGQPQSSALRNLADLPGQLASHHGPAVLAGLLTIAILLVWPRMPASVRAVPGPLVAVATVTALSAAAGVDMARVELPAEVFAIEFAPRMPAGSWWDVGAAVATIAIVASVQGLLSAMAVDRLHEGRATRLNRELLGQGAANMASGALGGLPVTGVIVRSSANVAAGARSRASAVLQGCWVLVFVVLLAGLIERIPLAALAGLLVYVGAKLIKISQLKELFRHGDLSLYVVTMLGVVVAGLLTGVIAGLALAVLLVLKRAMRVSIHVEHRADEDHVTIEGPVTFLSLPRLSRTLHTIQRGRVVTLRLAVDYLDHAAFDTLASWQRAHELAGGSVSVDEVGHPWFALGKAGVPAARGGGDVRR